MANVSRWKDWEAEVAAALGGKRRHRTMGSYATVVTDVFFPRKIRRKYGPRLNSVQIECKKRRKLDLICLFAEAVTKYGGAGKYVVLASKRPVGHFEAAKAKLRAGIEKRYAPGGVVQRQREKRIRKLRRELRRTKGRKHQTIRNKIKKEQKRIRNLRKDFFRIFKRETKLLRARTATTALVTVELSFFAELFKAWKKQLRRDLGRELRK